MKPSPDALSNSEVRRVVRFPDVWVVVREDGCYADGGREWTPHAEEAWCFKHQYQAKEHADSLERKGLRVRRRKRTLRILGPARRQTYDPSTLRIGEVKEEP